MYIVAGRREVCFHMLDFPIVHKKLHEIVTAISLGLFKQANSNVAKLLI